MSIYENIKVRAKERGIPVIEIERHFGWGRGSISKWGAVDPGAKRLKQVADVLGCTVDDLLRTKMETADRPLDNMERR